MSLGQMAKKVRAKEVWIDGSFRNNKTAYAIYYGSTLDNTAGVLSKRNKQTNNRGEMTALMISLVQTLDNKEITIFTDSKYVQDIGIKIIKDNKIAGDKNWDLIQVVRTLIRIREQKGFSTKIEHVNSHLLDKGAERKVKNFQRKLSDMKRKYGNRWQEILTGNQKADRLAEVALYCEQVEGNFSNTENKTWLLKLDKKIFDNLEGIADKFYEKRIKEHKTKYKEVLVWKLYNEDIDWRLSKSIFTSIHARNHQTQLTAFKTLFNKWKTRVAVQENEQMRLSGYNAAIYNTSACPFQCQQQEDAVHLLKCSANIKSLKKVARKILLVVNRNLGKQKKSICHADFFPSFYWPIDNSKYDITAYSNTFQQLSKTNPIIALSGLVPNTLRDTLTELGITKRRLNSTVHQIMAVIAASTKDRWSKRCRKLFAKC